MPLVRRFRTDNAFDTTLGKIITVVIDQRAATFSAGPKKSPAANRFLSEFERVLDRFAVSPNISTS
jgi:hypothetical protein